MEGNQPIVEQSAVVARKKAINESSYYGVGGFLLEIGKVILLALIIIAPIRAFLFQPFFVQGASMEPNFLDGEYLIVNELGYKTTNVAGLFKVTPFKSVERGDAVVFRYPKNPSQYYIKRVIGLPGETIQITGGVIQIFNSENPTGLSLNESAYLSASVYTKGDVKVSLSDKEYFVMGDNRPFSSDSRIWGAVPENDMVGKVLLRAWPITKAQIF
ncbi:signal peptidase I [Patescibacteria group bacterium]|nr:MAG: signal peptidase I [Patescibacteria group bacterium]